MPSVNEELFDLNVRHQVELQRLNLGAARRVVALLNRFDRDLMKQIERRGDDTGSFTMARLNKLLTSVREINKEAYERVEELMRDEVDGLAEYEAGFQAKTLRRAIPVEVDIVTPTRQQLLSAVYSRPFQGRLLKEWVAGMEEGRFARLRDAVRMSVVEGQSVNDLVKRIMGTKRLKYRDGILNVSRRSAEAIARTALNHTANYASEVLYAENLDLIEKVQWVSTLDSRTTPVCRSRDGKVYPVDDGPRPPAHINCRSTTIPITKSWRELGIDMDEMPEGTRASMDGQVPASMTYNAWLKQQPAEFQDEVLGKTRGALFRRGGLTMDRFVDKSGRQYTLDELKKREAKAFKTAGV